METPKPTLQMTTPGIVDPSPPRSAGRSAGIGLLSILGILAALTALTLAGLYVNDRFQTLEERISVNREYLHAEREELKRLSSRLLGLSGDSQRLEGELEKEDQKLRNAVRSSFQQARKRIEESRGDIEKLSAALEALAVTVEQLNQSHVDTADQSQARHTETEKNTESNRVAVENLRSRVSRIQGQLGSHLERLNQLGKTFEGLAAQVKSAEEAGKSNVVSLESNLQALSERVSLALNDFRTRLADLSARLDRLGGQEAF